MHIDDGAVDRFLGYVDGERPLDTAWDHPAYDVARRHASLLGRDLTKRDVEATLAGKETAFQGVENLEARRGTIIELRDHIRANEEEWLPRIRASLQRITPSADLDAIPIYLAIGYEFGIGLRDGAYVNLNEPLFHEDHRQALYVAIHESSHVVYDTIHGFSERLGPDDLATDDGQRRYFEVLFHTEAYATFTPLACRREDGNLGEHDHPVCRDYRVIDNDERLAELVETYDAFRGRLANGEASAQAVFRHVFGDLRLPYRLGTVMLDRAVSQDGLDTVQSGFRLDPERFLAEFDPYLDSYRKSTNQDRLN